FEKGNHTLCELNLWFIEQLITRQDNTMLTWQQIKRIHGLETKGKTPIWFKKLEETILEDQIFRRIKGSYAQQEEINESQIKPKKRKMWKKSPNKKVHILEWEENKENLVQDNPSSSSITPTNKILKMKENEVEDVSLWIKRKNEGGWVTAIGLKHLKNIIAPEKKTRGKRNLKRKQRELTQALEKNQ
ncbi:19373_t:CDS:2, partial [Gigaspora rosea]